MYHWRDKQRHEIDFVWKPRGRAPVAIECTWRAAQFDPASMRSFVKLHPRAACWLVAEDRTRWIERAHGDLTVIECGVEHLPELMARHRRP